MTCCLSLVVLCLKLFVSGAYRECPMNWCANLLGDISGVGKYPVFRMFSGDGKVFNFTGDLDMSQHPSRDLESLFHPSPFNCAHQRIAAVSTYGIPTAPPAAVQVTHGDVQWYCHDHGGLEEQPGLQPPGDTADGRWSTSSKPTQVGYGNGDDLRVRRDVWRILYYFIICSYHKKLQYIISYMQHERTNSLCCYLVCYVARCSR